MYILLASCCIFMLYFQLGLYSGFMAEALLPMTIWFWLFVWKMNTIKLLKTEDYNCKYSCISSSILFLTAYTYLTVSSVKS